ncbi:MAG: hypothetical protein ACOX9R_04295 [Armatimonadota bacterium]
MGPLTLTRVKELKVIAIMMVLVAAPCGQSASAQSVDLGGGFIDHGPFADVTVSRGTVCTVDGEGNDVVLVWLFDNRYAYALAVIDAQTGEIEEIPRPIERDCPFASILASNGRYYTYMGGHFIEFDPLQREFTFVQEGPSRAAMSMTEDDNGVIWAGIYPNADVVSYDPATGEFRHYGEINQHPALQYPRSMAADDEGWVYIAIGMAVGQIFILNADTGEVATVVPETDVVGEGGVSVFRGVDGKVYGYAPVGDEGRQWFELHGGEATPIDDSPGVARKQIIAGSQGLRHYDLPGGERVRELDLVEGRLVIENPETGDVRELEFEISGGGASNMGLTVAHDGTIAGGTYHPKRFFSYNPRTDEWIRRDCYGQWNVVATTEDRFYIASYTEGVLLEWDPLSEWVPTERDNPDSNPRYLAQTYGHPDVGRPYAMIAHPDGRHIIYGGTPGYGYTGGGLVFYDIETEKAEIIDHEQLIRWHSQASLVALPDGSILGGTTTAPGMGGTPRAEVAELYILDMETRQVQWHGAPIEGAQRYNDLIVGPDGLVFGIIDRNRFFVFDPETREIVHLAETPEEFGPSVHQQGPRIFIEVPDGRIFALFTGGIVLVNPETYELTMVAEAPRGLGNGGAYLDGRLYFAGGVNLLSWPVPPAE